MYCKNCGALLQEGTVECPYCKTVVGNKPEEVKEEVKEEVTPVEEVSTSEVPAPVEKTEGYINPDGSAAVAPTPEEPKEPGKKKVGLLVAIIVVVVLIGCGVFFYMYEFKSASARIEGVYNYLTKFVDNMSNDTVEQASGSYEVDGSVSFADNKISTNISGKYGVDLVNKIVDYTVNVNKLNVGEELLDKPLSVELYLNDSKVYVLLENFFDKYIYSDVETTGELFEIIEQNDINYATIVKGVRAALGEGLKSMNASQGIETVTINGSSKKVNVVRIELTAANQKLLVNGTFNAIKKNSNLVKEIATIAGVSVDEVKSLLDSLMESATYEDIKGLKFELYSPIFGSSFEGARIVYDEAKVDFEVAAITDGYSFNLKVNNKKMFDVELTATEKKNSTNTEYTSGIKGVVQFDEQAIKFDLKVKETQDVNPKVEKVNVKNSVKYDALTADDMLTIMNKVKNFGKLGVLLSSYLDTPTIPDISYDTNDITSDITDDITIPEF